MENELVIKAKQHDRNAFVELIDKHRLSMYKVARAILKNDEDIADAIQDTILICWEKIGGLKHTEYFKTWLIKILINRCNRIYTQRKRFVLENEVPEQASETLEIELVEWKEIIDTLNAKQRIVFELYYIEEFKVKEIAQILGIGQSAVKGRLQAARKIIEQQLEDNK